MGCGASKGKNGVCGQVEEESGASFPTFRVREDGSVHGRGDRKGKRRRKGENGGVKDEPPSYEQREDKDKDRGKEKDSEFDGVMTSSSGKEEEDAYDGRWRRWKSSTGTISRHIGEEIAGMNFHSLDITGQAEHLRSCTGPLERSKKEKKVVDAIPELCAMLGTREYIEETYQVQPDLQKIPFSLKEPACMHPNCHAVFERRQFLCVGRRHSSDRTRKKRVLFGEDTQSGRARSDSGKGIGVTSMWCWFIPDDELRWVDGSGSEVEAGRDRICGAMVLELGLNDPECDDGCEFFVECVAPAKRRPLWSRGIPPYQECLQEYPGIAETDDIPEPILGPERRIVLPSHPCFTDQCTFRSTYIRVWTLYGRQWTLSKWFEISADLNAETCHPDGQCLVTFETIRWCPDHVPMVEKWKREEEEEEEMEEKSVDSTSIDEE
eukprot:TRINITY_DN13559_c0_g1_i1.p1 TRINITY_DN13559_c0_g1~~TRINITY_DN13559_c0_g1_i1.p1  ORF type:complete len:472 (-),score=125.35 TRINITY_DN13559_c0_g1_i1:198-1505(-)